MINKKNKQNHSGFSREEIGQIWARKFGGESQTDLQGLDDFGNLISYYAYDESSPMGWKIDSVEIASNDNDEDFSNLRPVHWSVNLQEKQKVG